MLVSARNISVPDKIPYKTTKQVIVPENKSLPVSRMPDYLSHSLNSITGQVISFQAKRENVDDISRLFFETNYFSDNKSVPDGFKINGNLFLIDGVKNHVTIVDRKKDKDLQEIFQEYQNQIPVWQKQFMVQKGENLKLNWQTYLIESTKNFITSYSKLFLENSQLYLQESKKKLDILADEKTYLGKIITSGIGVCRHDSFLFKLLMETQNIPVACQTGFYLNPNLPYNSMLHAHMWNVMGKGTSLNIVDIIGGKSNISQYLNKNLDYLYLNKSDPISLRERFEQDILDMQPGQEIRIGYDKDNNLVTDKINPDADFELKLIWNEEDKFELHKLKETIDQKFKICSKYPVDKVNILEDKIYARYGNTNFLIDPNDIRANFNRLIEKVYVQLTYNIGLRERLFFIDDFLRANPNFSPKALEIFSNFKNIGVRIFKDKINFVMM
jgi:hypothetical protein